MKDKANTLVWYLVNDSSLLRNLSTYLVLNKFKKQFNKEIRDSTKICVQICLFENQGILDGQKYMSI